MSNPKYGSLEVYYTYPSNTSKSVELLTNIQGLRQFHVGLEILNDISLVITSVDNSGELFVQIQTKLAATVVDQADFSTYQGSAVNFAVRIFFFDQFVSVMVNDKWVYSYAFSSIAYTQDVTASLKLNGATTTITDIRRVELSDGREAVYVDYESTTDNAIQSVIQQRPVQILPHVDRKLTFTYDQEKDTLTAVFVHRYDEAVGHPPALSSDGLVYAEDVGVSIDRQTAKEVGLITKLYRLSELNTGAERAAGVAQKRAREGRLKETVVMRLDPRIEITDVLHLNLTVESTNRVINTQLVVEDARISMRDGDTVMTVTGRKKSAS